MPFTKAEVYNRLISAGISAGHFVVPEYRIKFHGGKREADLAWCIPHPTNAVGRPWIPVGVFEIEGHDVQDSRPGDPRGIEKDVESMLAAARYSRETLGVDVIPAAAVVLFQLSPDGEVHNTNLRADRIDEKRAELVSCVQTFFDRNPQNLPQELRSTAPPELVLDDDLESRLPRLLEVAGQAKHVVDRIRAEAG